MEGQLAVAYTIVNRVNHQGYPNTLKQVVFQKTGGDIYQYNTLSEFAHEKAWIDARIDSTTEYRNAVKASGDPLCGRVSDPTKCATNYCAEGLCSVTNSNKWRKTTNKTSTGMQRMYLVVAYHSKCPQ